MKVLSTDEYIDMLIGKLATKYNISSEKAKNIFHTSSAYKSFHLGKDYAQYQMTRSFDSIIDEAYEEREQGLYYA